MTSETAGYDDLLVAAQSGDLAALHELAMRRRLGIGQPADPETGAVLLRRAARRGFAEAQFELGMMYAGGEGVSRDECQAAHWLRRAAQQGQPRALYWLASRCYYGIGVPRDMEQAYRLCLSARLNGLCDAGGILAAAAQYIGLQRCHEIAAELGTVPPPVWETTAA